jgi:hypothetical protein
MTSYNLRNVETTINTQKMKAVRFANDVEHIKTDAIRKDTGVTWFTSREMRRIKDRDAKLARRLSNTIFEDQLQSHGVESECGRNRRKVRVMQGTFCVLLAQEELWDKDKVDPELIARIYSKYTKKSAWAAHESGVICESQVRPYMLLKEDLSRSTITDTKQQEESVPSPIGRSAVSRKAAWQLREQTRRRGAGPTPKSPKIDASTKLPPAFRQLHEANPRTRPAKLNELITNQEWQKRKVQSKKIRGTVRESIAAWLDDDEHRTLVSVW